MRGTRGVQGRSGISQGVCARATIDGNLHRECGLRIVVLDGDTFRLTRECSIVHPCRRHHLRRVGRVPHAADAALDGVGKLFKKTTAMDADLPEWQSWLLM